MHFRIVFLSVILPLLVSCDNGLDNSGLNYVGEYNLTINVLANFPETKDLLTATYFPNNSQLGISVTNASGGDYDGLSYNNVCFTANGSDANQTWTGERDVLLSSTQGYCSAYYPYSEAVGDVSAIPVNTSTQTDYLYGTSVAVSASNHTASFTMKHALAAIRLAVKLGTYTGTGTLSAVSVSSSALGTSAVLNAKTGELSGVSGKGSSISVAKSLSLNSTAQNVDVIVVPTGVAADLTLSVTIDGQAYSTVVSGATVSQGDCHIYTLTVNAGELALSGIKIGDWTYNNEGSPTITAGGHTITFAGDYEGLLFQNKVVSDSEVTITACSRSGKTVRPVTASAGALTQTYDGIFSVLTLSDITSDITVNFDGAGVEQTVFKRFFPAGTYTWTVPEGVDSVDVFLVGAGGGAWVTENSGRTSSGGGGGYTKTFRGSGYVAPASGTWIGTSTEGRDGDAVSVTPGESITIIVGAGVAGADGGYSQFKNANYRANGGCVGIGQDYGGNGGSGGSGGIDNSSGISGGSDGSDGYPSSSSYKGKGQGHTTRDFGEPSGKRNAGGGAWRGRYAGGASDYTEGSGYNAINTTNGNLYGGYPGGGYGGGAGTPLSNSSSRVGVAGGDGTVLIRYKILQ